MAEERWGAEGGMGDGGAAGAGRGVSGRLERGATAGDRSLPSTPHLTSPLEGGGMNSPKSEATLRTP